MEILRFTLSGKNAFFKKPEVNTYCYFTYGNIHKVVILGIFGAILGYRGYTQMQTFEKNKKMQKPDAGFPEFYERLKGLNISVLPVYKKGLIPKKVQVFNNSVGYASKEQGGNLIVKEQWLENPKWEICVLIDSDEAEKVKEAVCQRKCVYYPYLGKNDHPADIMNISLETANPAVFDRGRLDCFFPKDKVHIADLDYDELEELEGFSDFKYEELLPYGMNSQTNHYIMRTFQYTDALVETDNLPVYELGDRKKVVFY